MTCPRGVPGTIVSLVVLLIIEKHLAYSLHFFVTGTRLFGVDLEAKVLHQPKARLRPPRPVFWAQRGHALMAGSLPQRSRSQGRPSGVASAGWPLTGAGAKGTLLQHDKQPFTEQLNRRTDRERLHPLTPARRFSRLFHFVE